MIFEDSSQRLISPVVERVAIRIRLRGPPGKRGEGRRWEVKL